MRLQQHHCGFTSIVSQSLTVFLALAFTFFANLPSSVLGRAIQERDDCQAVGTLNVYSSDFSPLGSVSEPSPAGVLGVTTNGNAGPALTVKVCSTYVGIGGDLYHLQLEVCTWASDCCCTILKMIWHVAECR